MSNRQGDFIWYELMTRDADAAQAFYSEVLGWQFSDSGMPGMDYRIGSMGDVPVVGLLNLTDEMLENGAYPQWTGYISVDDVEDSVRRTSKSGGGLLMDPQDVEGVGRFAFVTDPHGVPFYLMSATGEASQSFAKYQPADGHCAWNELLSPEPDAALQFYCDLFGWQKADEMDMGEMGMYQMLRQDDYLIGAVMKKPMEAPTPLWIYYFRVPDIDAATKHVSDQGGRLLHGPTDIPGGEFIAQGLDPQGALFAIIGKRITPA
ncbi:VOC family protein [Granulosicoccus sp. 3-233]|uniref:VOC family protein n=1 Tax=Granulosicoccus sp. 3-233 TaxID=3417969 RepID=UPI003D32E3B8